MVRTLIGLKVASSMFAMRMAAGIALCKSTKFGICGKPEVHNSHGSNENSAPENP